MDTYGHGLREDNVVKIFFKTLFSEFLLFYCRIVERLFRVFLIFHDDGYKVRQRLSSFIPVVLFCGFLILGLCVLYALVFYDLNIQKEFVKLSLKPDPLAGFKNSPYPVLRSINLPDLSARGVVVLEDSSGVVIYSKNGNGIFHPASTTKLMSAIVAREFYARTSVLSAKRIGVEPVILGLRMGEQIDFENALYALLLPSANDVAYLLADNYPGGVDAFVHKMNRKSSDFKLMHTHFVDPAGLEDEGDQTTPRELVEIGRVSMRDQWVSSIVVNKTYQISDEAGEKFFLKSTNDLLGLPGVEGIKTGFTDEAGGVLLTRYVAGGHTYYIVVMKSADRFGDTRKILNFLSDNVTYLSMHP